MATTDKESTFSV